jgi:putative aminopeptidase FrvX
METTSVSLVEDIRQRVEASRGEIIHFMREIVAIPSMDGQFKDVGERIIAEMIKLGLDEARFHKMGNVLVRNGSGVLCTAAEND